MSRTKPEPPATFYVPHAGRQNTEAEYAKMVAKIKDMFKWTVSERRIASIVYAYGKRVITATVGQYEQFENEHEIVAIIESNVYIIMTRSEDGAPGPMILVDGKDVSHIVDFVD